MKVELNSASVRQAAMRGELQRRVRFESAQNGDVHVIIEAQDFSGDEDFLDEMARATVTKAGLEHCMMWIANPE